MKNVFLILIAFLVSISLDAQSLKSHFESLEEGDEYAVITVNKQLFKMLGSFDIEMEEDVDIKEIIKDINKLKIYALDEGASYEDFKKVQTLAESASMDQLLSVKDGSERVYLYTNSSDGSNIVKDLLLLVREGEDDGSNVFIWLDGKINLNDISKIAKKFDIDNLDHLEKIDRM